MKERIQRIIFETDTPAGKLFDVVLLWLILLSVVAVILESVPQYASNGEELFRSIDWFFTSIFTIEYFLRIYVSSKTHKIHYKYLGDYRFYFY